MIRILFLACFSIASYVWAAPVHFDLVDNRIFVQVMVNKAGPFSFILDTGATATLSPQVAAFLGVATYDPFQISGAGQKTITAAYADVDEISVGDTRLEKQKILVMDFGEVRDAIGFKKWDGVIGYEFFNAFATAIDFDGQTITFSPYSDFQPPSGEIKLPFEWSDTIPVVRATVDGLDGTFWIDTGDRSSLTLNVPYVAKNDLMQKYLPSIHTITGFGVGGGIPAWVTRVHELSIGGVSVQEPVTRLPTVSAGAFASKDVSGNIGLGILKRFNLTFDYRHQVMFLKGNSAFSVFENYDRAGMWLSDRGSFFEVLDVVKGGPADQAGIAVGDQVISVDGRPANQIFLPELRDRLKDPNEQRIAIKTWGSKGLSSVSLNLRNLL